MTTASGAGARRAPEPQGPLEELLHSQEFDVLRGVAASSRLTEELALCLLARRDLPHQAMVDLSKNAAVMKHRKVVVAVVAHPRTPRHVSLPIARHLYTFELMQIALTPSIAADLKMLIEESLIARMESISSGERLTLAKRGSTRVAAALLTDPEERVMHAALENPYMTEAWIVKALVQDDAPVPLVHAVCRHSKWSLRRDVQIALLRNDKTPLARALAFADNLPSQVLRDVLHHSRLEANVKTYLLELLERRSRHPRDAKKP
ncbi:MAG TPA: hypothetical protein VF840_10115 [Terriglobales bacterium]